MQSSIGAFCPTAETPNRSLTLIIPRPRISRCPRVISGESPTRRLAIRRTTTESSDISLWPLVIRSSAHSDLPMPDSPISKTPVPYIPNRTPCIVTCGARRSWRKVVIRLIARELITSVRNKGIEFASAYSISGTGICSPFVTIMHGIICGSSRFRISRYSWDSIFDK